MPKSDGAEAKSDGAEAKSDVDEAELQLLITGKP